MKKGSNIGYNLIMISGGILLITYFSKYKYDWLYYLGGLLAVVGVILSFIVKKKNKP